MYLLKKMKFNSIRNFSVYIFRLITYIFYMEIQVLKNVNGYIVFSIGVSYHI